ncbi:hypothetical protein Ait01nite_081990 [Actinoplanes italicus]|uniref:Secreted protein n=1 Tax=Actinoplanes italicus TaxID=113567 RepID=A0A2T0K381_9ACTN|nr:hypothetical protein [Actinoplanes italicus]PRX17289.1 hypothetical protein CLV67_11665 [Actinoplanes italicus]GIE35154.1 hypothetical protein Ait01nite_081990 [Actinoplanes italicus]
MSTPVTEFPFTLPVGYVDAGGAVHREGRMRLSTAGDEILPLKDPRVQANPAYLSVILLSRVIVSLGDLEVINPHVVEGLFAADMAHLHGVYNRINGGGPAFAVVCPYCERGFDVEPEPPGESSATPSTVSTGR